jgi:ligand-binding SRPBCC domain-containing protein
VRWKTLIEVWGPESVFEDVQLKGPYKRWHHRHSFKAIGQDRTLMHDRVEYALPLSLIGRFVHRVVVRRMLTKIFDYREQAIARLLPEREGLHTEVSDWGQH